MYRLRIPEAFESTAAEQEPLAKTEDDPADHRVARETLAWAGDFRFVLRQGGGLTGYDTLVVDASGNARMFFHPKRRERDPRSTSYRVVRFRLSTEQMTALRSEIATDRIFDLKRSYSADVFDGTSWYVHVRAANDQKTVACHNHFPREVIALSNFVRALVPPLPVDLQDAGEALTADELIAIAKEWGDR